MHVENKGLQRTLIKTLNEKTEEIHQINHRNDFYRNEITEMIITEDIYQNCKHLKIGITAVL